MSASHIQITVQLVDFEPAQVDGASDLSVYDFAQGAAVIEGWPVDLGNCTFERNGRAVGRDFAELVFGDTITIVAPIDEATTEPTDAMHLPQSGEQD